MNKQEKLEKLTSEYKDCERLVDDLRDYISDYVPSPMREGDVLPTLEMLWKSITVMYYVSKESCERKKKERAYQDEPPIYDMSGEDLLGEALPPRSYQRNLEELDAILGSMGDLANFGVSETSENHTRTYAP